MAGEEVIEMTLDAGIDVLHHAHGIADKQISRQNGKGRRSLQHRWAELI